MKNPLAIELFSGLNGWGTPLIEEGWRVLSFDIFDMEKEAGLPRDHRCQLVLQDVCTLHGAQFVNADLIVASPPCQDFSRWDQPWTRARWPNPPNMNLWRAAERIQTQASIHAGRHIPLIIENVRGAQRYAGIAKAHFGKQYLWGDVPALLPAIDGAQNDGRQKQTFSSTAKAQRAKIPEPLARHIAQVFKP